jgi:hypothetical protein
MNIVQTSNDDLTICTDGSDARDRLAKLSAGNSRDAQRWQCSVRNSSKRARTCANTGDRDTESRRFSSRDVFM